MRTATISLATSITARLGNPEASCYRSDDTRGDFRDFSCVKIILLSLRQWYGYSSNKNLGPVVRSVVSLTSSLRVISLTVLVDSMYNILIFFAEKMWVAFALQKLLSFFQQKFQRICVSLDVNFNESLTNDIVSLNNWALKGCLRKHRTHQITNIFKTLVWNSAIHLTTLHIWVLNNDDIFKTTLWLN